MRVAVIHDRPETAEEIKRVVRQVAGDDCRIDMANDVLTAHDLLRAGFYDLAVIDLTLPTMFGRGEATLEKTEVLLAEIFEMGTVKVPADILGISLDPDVLTLVKTTIGQHLMGCIHEDPADLWKEDLAAKIRYVRAAGRARQLVANSNYDWDLVIVTALDKEAAPFHTLFSTSPMDEFRNAHRFDFVDMAGTTRRGVLFSIGKSGQAPAGSATQALLSQFRPRLALMSGFCGGVAGRAGMGDAVFFASSAAWDYGKWQEGKDGSSPVFLPRPGALTVPVRGVSETVRAMFGAYEHDDALIGAVAKASKRKVTSWKFIPASAGSGSAVVTSVEKLDEITSADDEIRAIDMESYAFYHACKHTPVREPDFACIKSVADNCNGEKDDTLHEACSLISAAIVREIVTRRHNFGG